MLARRAEAHGNRNLRNMYMVLEGRKRLASSSTPQETFDAIRQATAVTPPTHPNLVTDMNTLPRTPLK